MYVYTHDITETSRKSSFDQVSLTKEYKKIAFVASALSTLDLRAKIGGLRIKIMCLSGGLFIQ